MSAKGKYICRKNIKYNTYINRVEKKRILGVAIDPSKHFHKVLIFNFHGRIITQPFSIITLKSGFEKLFKEIQIAQNKIKSIDTYIAIEGRSNYSDNLYNQLHIKKSNIG